MTENRQDVFGIRHMLCGTKSTKGFDMLTTFVVPSGEEIKNGTSPALLQAIHAALAAIHASSASQTSKDLSTKRVAAKREITEPAAKRQKAQKS